MHSPPKAEYSIRIPVYAESIEYREGEVTFVFEVFLGRRPLQLFAGSYWTEHGKAFYKLTQDEKDRIIPRLVAYLGSHGEPVEVVW